jgi:leucyl aminopeptidase
MAVPDVECRGEYRHSRRHSHLLFVAAADKKLPSLPEPEQWQAVVDRRRIKATELAKTTLAVDLPGGQRACCVMVDAALPRFERLSALRKAVMTLLDESPKELAIIPVAVGAEIVCDAVYVSEINAVPLPARKKKPAKALEKICVYGDVERGDLTPAVVLAEANRLARELTALPPNVLTPADYRKRLRGLAKERDWTIEELPFRRLLKMGAGAFCAVAQGSDHEDAAIVHLSWRPKHANRARRRVALVGKGICFDTGGHNLKPAKYMAGMHEDMNGSAVAVALLQAVQALKLDVVLDVWLAIAHNHLSPTAYTQGDVVTALDGTTIEVVHTDAEGRMVLADTLTLAARGSGDTKPDLIIDFATLTGSMVTALGTRLSGVFASNDHLADLAVAAGTASGERVCAFPLSEDYDTALESKVADIKQCTLDGEADHILGARFLKHFVGNRAWLHVDLSAAGCVGGLGAVASQVTGFGVAWGAALLAQWLARES